MFFAFGLCFEVPVAVVILAAMGIVDAEKLSKGPQLRHRLAPLPSPRSSPRRICSPW